MIIMANGMSSELKNWCSEELNFQLNTNNTPEIGLDLTTGRLTPVTLTLLDLLG